MEKISTIIITGNAESTIEKCLESVKDISDEIIVVDSLSTDKTLDYVRKYTDKVFSQEWLGYSKQKQVALEKTKNNWILWVDADEVLSTGLVEKIKGLDFTQEGYCFNRKTFYLNRMINHCGWHPDYVLRLFRKDKGTLTDDLVHEKVILSGDKVYLKELLYHYSYRNVSHHLEKMNEFTSLAAQKMYDEKKKVTPLSTLFHSLGHFIKVYFIKLGFLDGFAGFVVCTLSGYYVFLKYVKLWELYRQNNS